MLLIKNLCENKASLIVLLIKMLDMNSKIMNITIKMSMHLHTKKHIKNN